MYHSITFGNKNTWDDWRLIPSSRPYVSPPGVKTSYVSLPGGDGNLDLTESLVGRPLYENREGTFEFIVDNDFKPWNVLYSDIMNYFQGKDMNMILEDEPDYYYYGRYSVSNWISGATNSTITITYNVEPYKYSVNSTNENWLWDSFNFQNGIIRYFKNIVIVEQLRLVVVGNNMPVPLNVTSSHKMTVNLYRRDTGITIGRQLLPGRNIIHDMILYDGPNVLFFYGNGTISIDYRGGKL